MSTITARFYVAAITSRAKASNHTVVLQPAYANGKNADWAVATPSGRIELEVNNPAANEVFTEWLAAGHDLHIAITPVPELEDAG